LILNPKNLNGTTGQTGAGKSFTMFGSLGDPDQQGIIPRAVKLMFERIMGATNNCEFTISCSYLEVYKEEVSDAVA
jgi:kinesin family protein 5